MQFFKMGDREYAAGQAKSLAWFSDNTDILVTMSRLTHGRFLLMAGLAATMPAISSAANLYAVGSAWDDGSSNLFRILNYSTAPVAVDMGEIGLSISDIAWDDATNTFYGIAGQVLYSIASNGASTYIGNLGGNYYQVNSLEIDQAGTMYGWSSTTGELYEINKLTAKPKLIGTTSTLKSAGDLAVDGTGQLYGSSISNHLVKIDKGTGLKSTVGGFGFNQMYGLEVDTDGTMYAGRGDDFTGLAEIYTVTQSTGVAKLVGKISGAENLGLYGLTFDANPVPEPTAVAVLLVGLAALRSRGRADRPNKPKKA